MPWILTNTIVAVLAFILAIGSLCWQILTYFRTHHERIKGKLCTTAIPISPGSNIPALQLDLCNDGHIPVYIKSVALTWGDEDLKLGHTLTSLEFKQDPPQNKPLQPGDGTRYVLACTLQDFLSKASQQPADNVWVSVKSQKKEVLRIKGNDLKPYLHVLTASFNHSP